MTREKRRFTRSPSIRSTHSQDNEEDEFWRGWLANVPVFEPTVITRFEDPIVPSDFGYATDEEPSQDGKLLY